MIKQKLSKKSRGFVSFVKNNNAVLGLPMRLTVVIIIGTIALLAIVAFILTPCLFPEKVIVSVDPTVNTIAGGDEATFDITVYVSDREGNPIKNANVLIEGLGGAGAAITGNDGRALIRINVRLEPGRIQGFLDVTVKAGTCYEKFSQSDMITVVRA